MLDFSVFSILPHIGCQICYVGGIPSPAIEPGFFILASFAGIIATGLVIVKTITDPKYKKSLKDDTVLDIQNS